MPAWKASRLYSSEVGPLFGREISSGSFLTGLPESWLDFGVYENR